MVDARGHDDEPRTRDDGPCPSGSLSVVWRLLSFVAIKAAASQSSSSALLGSSPLTPKLLGVLTRPVPKCWRQTRFTHTRAVSGFSGLAIQFASASRRPVVFEFAGAGPMSVAPARQEMNPGVTSVP